MQDTCLDKLALFKNLVEEPDSRLADLADGQEALQGQEAMAKIHVHTNGRNIINHTCYPITHLIAQNGNRLGKNNAIVMQEYKLSKTNRMKYETFFHI